MGTVCKQLFALTVMVFNWSSSLSVKVWDDEMIVFHHESGDTHFFSEQTKKIVGECLSRKNFELSTLQKWAGATLGGDYDSDAYVESIVNELLRNDLITA